MKKQVTEEKHPIGTELIPWGPGMQILRVGIPVGDEFLKVLTELANIRGSDLRRYVGDAVHDQVDNDLDNPTDIGMDVCRDLKEIIYPEGEKK